MNKFEQCTNEIAELCSGENSGFVAAYNDDGSGSICVSGNGVACLSAVAHIIMRLSEIFGSDVHDTVSMVGEMIEVCGKNEPYQPS